MMLHRHFEAKNAEPIPEALEVQEGHDIVETVAPEHPAEEQPQEPVKRSGRAKKNTK